MTWTKDRIEQAITTTQLAIVHIKIAQKKVLADCEGRHLEDLPKAFRQFNSLKIAKASSNGRLRLLKQLLAV